MLLFDSYRYLFCAGFNPQPVAQPSDAQPLCQICRHIGFLLRLYELISLECEWNYWKAIRHSFRQLYLIPITVLTFVEDGIRAHVWKSEHITIYQHIALRISYHFSHCRSYYYFYDSVIQLETDQWGINISILNNCNIRYILERYILLSLVMYIPYIYLYQTYTENHKTFSHNYINRESSAFMRKKFIVALITNLTLVRTYFKSWKFRFKFKFIDSCVLCV